MNEGERPEFYRIDSSRFSFREYWWGNKNPIILLIAGIIKVLRVSMGGSTDDPPVSAVGSFEVPQNEIPQDILSRFSPVWQELGSMGFAHPLFHRIEDPLNFTTYYWATFMHSSGKAFARIHCRTWTKTHPPKFHLFPYFVSVLADGRFVLSSSGKPDTELPGNVTALRMQGASTGKLWQAHLDATERQTQSAHLIRDHETLRWGMESFHAATRDFNLGRKAFKRIATHDEKELAIINEARATAEASGSVNADVLAEMDLLQKAPRRWVNSIWLIVISGLAFLLAGGAQSGFKFALMLIPILLFHELGHYLAMFIFKYRNLRMFFIPFLGAAVTGQNYNVAGWKKTIVFLMGPLPGIFLGCALVVAGIMRDNPAVLSFASVLIFLNGFNLLPLLPLDGGRVVGILLFSRHFILDVVFRGLAAIGMMLLGFAIETKLLMYLGLFSLISLPASIKIANVVEKIRDLKLPTVTEDGETIPIATADVIAGELKQKFPKGLSAKNLAEHALNIFEMLNSRPPGWLATVFFLAVYACSIGIAFLGVGFIELHKHGGLDAFSFGPMPEDRVSAELIATRAHPDAKTLRREEAVALVATFKKAPTAREIFEKHFTHLPPAGEGLLFGNSVFLRFPATNQNLRSKLFEQMNSSTTNIFLERTNYISSFTFQFFVPETDQDEEWFKELETYWNTHHTFRLVPPWSPAELLPPEDRKRFARARETYDLLISGPKSESRGESKEEKEERRAMATAFKMGDNETINALTKKARDRGEAERRKHVESIKQLPDTKVDRAVLDACVTYPAADTNALPAYHASIGKLAGMLGTITNANPQLTNFMAGSGYLFKKSDRISVNGVTFENTFEGAPQFIRWLEGRGVKVIYYSVTGISWGRDLDSEAGEE